MEFLKSGTLDSPILLGVLEQCGGLKISEFTDSKVGGFPIWINDYNSMPFCRRCKKSMCFVVQLYCPLYKSEYHRVLYIFACADRSCWSEPSKCWSVIRCQKLSTPLRVTEPESNSTSSDFIDWGVDESWDQDEDCSNHVDQVFGQDQQISQSNESTSLLKVEQEFSKMNFEDTKSSPDKIFSDTTSLTSRQHSDIQNPPLDTVFPEYFVNVIEQPSTEPAAWDSLKHAQKLLAEYVDQENINLEDLISTNKASSNVSHNAGEKYEKTALKHGDHTFYHFKKLIELFPSQVLRYQYSGVPLYISTPSSDFSVPVCSSCKSARLFEFQLIPTLINSLTSINKNRQESSSELYNVLEFGTVIVYTCSKNCWRDNDLYKEEFIFVQEDPDQNKYFK